MPWCPNCKVEYQQGFKTCIDCDAELVDELKQLEKTNGQNCEKLIKEEQINTQANNRKLTLIAKLSALIGLIIYIIILGTALIETTVDMNRGTFILFYFFGFYERISLIYGKTYLLFAILLLIWIYYSCSNLLNFMAAQPTRRDSEQRLSPWPWQDCSHLINYMAAQPTQRNSKRRFRQWPWQSFRRTVLAASKKVLPASAVLKTTTPCLSPHPDATWMGIGNRRFPFFAVTGFFIPLWCFCHPYFIMMKLWAGSADDKTPTRARVIGFLWWLSNPIFGLISIRHKMWLTYFISQQSWSQLTSSGGLLQQIFWPDYCSSLLFIPYTCWLIFAINKKQKIRFQKELVGGRAP